MYNFPLDEVSPVRYSLQWLVLDKRPRNTIGSIPRIFPLPAPRTSFLCPFQHFQGSYFNNLVGNFYNKREREQGHVWPAAINCIYCVRLVRGKGSLCHGSVHQRIYIENCSLRPPFPSPILDIFNCNSPVYKTLKSAEALPSVYFFHKVSHPETRLFLFHHERKSMAQEAKPVAACLRPFVRFENGAFILQPRPRCFDNTNPSPLVLFAKISSLAIPCLKGNFCPLKKHP